MKNIILMIADDQRFDTINALGNSEIQTPNLDRLVDRGTAFTRAHMMGSMNGAVCIPGRGMMLTGRTLFRGVDPIPDHIPLLPQHLSQNGYHTFATGKWHNGRDTFARGFDHGENIFFGGMSDHDKVPIWDFDPDGNYPNSPDRIGDKFSSELFADSATNFIDRYDRDQPFFLYTAFTSPHDPRTPPTDFEYDPDQIELPENFYPEHPFSIGHDRVRDEVLAPFPRTPEVIRQHIADYYGMISHQDFQIGRILDALDRNELTENTIIIYTADHGLAVGQHGLLGKQNVYDHSIRVPFIFSGDGIPKNHRSSTFCYILDLFPTLCDLIGIEAPETVEGKSLAEIFSGDRETHRETLFAAYQNFQRTVKDDRFKLIEHFVDRRTQLFDLQNDPSEINNLADLPEHRSHLENLRSLLTEWQKEISDPLLGN